MGHEEFKGQGADRGESRMDSEPVVRPPAGFDPHWREKVELAKREREQAKRARKGQPPFYTWPTVLRRR
ncbi:MAG: hypothetical protein OXE96_00495 [Gemmatimonadetes bacterium]|nr:hypothetical protein [Gemmatimonadota bacterium]